MEVQLMLPSPPPDFNFDSACTSPYISAPSSPQRFGTFFYSAPASPSRAPLSSVPFDWEETPGTPKHHKQQSSSSLFDEYDDSKDFAFDFSGHLDSAAPFSAADELFDGGKIKPLKPPPGNSGGGDYPLSPRSPRSPKKMLKEALSFKHRVKGPEPEFDPFEAAMEQTRKEVVQVEPRQLISTVQRGRERTQTQTPSARQKGARSLSPFRVSDLLMDQEMSSNGDKNGSFSSFWQRKWKLKDLLLFRSASEGTGRASSATKDDQLKKFSLLRKSSDTAEDVRNSSFRSTDSVGSSVSSSKRRGQVSAHELHYTANRAVSEELKRKTFLPYRQGVFGCLGFNRGIPIQEISRNLGSIHRV